MKANINNLLIQSLNVKRFVLFVKCSTAEIADHLNQVVTKFQKLLHNCEKNNKMHGVSVAILNEYQILKIKKIPSFIGIKNLLSKQKVTLTIRAFTPILPYPSTQFDTIYICMKNFQDILKQRKLL